MSGAYHSNRLEDQAAATAMSQQRDESRPSILDEDGKLSSASAAKSLKYAQAQDLPSFPSAGLKLSSAGAAASLADSNRKNFEHWKPGAIPAANKAALLAKDYEMDPLWQPEMSAAGSKAALLAHRDTTSPDIWRSQGTQAGQSAAGQAFNTKPPSAITERDISADARQKAMLAATGAMAVNRPRSGSTPVSTGEPTNWALKAANSTQKGIPNMGPFASGDPGFEAARVQNMAKNNVDRQLYGSNPPVAIEVEEKNRQDMLRASAVAMAKQMYAVQQKQSSEAATPVNRSRQRTLSESSAAGDEELVTTTGNRYGGLEEAARKLAQERLAKMRDEHAEYRQYYGASRSSTRSRLSMRLRGRGSVSGRDEDSSDDEEQSRRIRGQMSAFQNKVKEVDNQKRQADRDALLEAAHRNVEARMAKLDEKVFQETGKASPAQRELWEQQAREKAQKASDERMVNVGKVHIGGGKYLDQAEVDAIARARLQPTLDEITATAERQRARDAEIRADHERAQEQMKKEKEREAEAKAELKAAERREKEEKQRKKDAEKLAQSTKLAAEKEARKAEEIAEKERRQKEKQEKQALADQEREKARAEKEKREAELKAAKEAEKQRKEEEKLALTSKMATENEAKKLEELEEKQKKDEEKVELTSKMAAENEAKGAEELAEQERLHKENLEKQAAADEERARLERNEKQKSIDEKPKRLSSLLGRKNKGTTKAGAETTAITAEKKTQPEALVVPAGEGNTVHEQVTMTPFEELDESKLMLHQPGKSAEVTPAKVETPASPTKRESKVKSWFKSLTSSKSTAEEHETTTSTSTAPATADGAEKTRDDSIRDVAMAGRETHDLYGTGSKEPIRESEVVKKSRNSSISSYSERDASIEHAQPLPGDEHTAQVGRTGLKAKLMEKVKSDNSGEPARESTATADDDDEQQENFEEAKDKFEDDKLVLPPSLSNAKVPINPPSSHEHSKFKEEL